MNVILASWPPWPIPRWTLVRYPTSYLFLTGMWNTPSDGFLQKAFSQVVIL
jgi:hypothetical protein